MSKLFFTDNARRRWLDAYEAGRARASEPACECEEAEDAGRQRFARMPEQNHYPAGGFADESNPADFLVPQEADPRNQRNLRPGARPAEYRGTGAAPDYSGAYEALPSASQNTHAGRLNTPIVSGPRTDRRDIGFSGAPMTAEEYDPRLNLSVTQPRGEVLGNNTARGSAGMRPEQMGSKASSADAIRRVQAANRRFWKNNGLQQTESEEELAANESQVTPPGSPRLHTGDRTPLKTMPGAGSKGARFGTLASIAARQPNPAVAALQRMNRSHNWTKHH